jgi:predicted O-linked N-acetylglucosamine transferase (SPINDLY family)
VVRLPDTYQANDSSRQLERQGQSRREAGLPDDGFVFCCFNSSYKITPSMFDIWMRLLQQVEGSVLWLFAGHSAVPRNLRREAERRGIDPQRLVFASPMALEGHLARHQLADLFLDTLPYNAHTTASDALWARLPVITCPGPTFAGRVAASLLHAIGLPELVASSLEDYEVLALRIARSPDLLAEVRAKLVGNRETCPLFDARRFAHHIEAAYTVMWERHLRGEAPAGFSVEPISG